jgi:hypothetical protein
MKADEKITFEATETPAVLVHSHKSIQELPRTALEEDSNLKAVVESDVLRPAFRKPDKLAPYPMSRGAESMEPDEVQAPKVRSRPPASTQPDD